MVKKFGILIIILYSLLLFVSCSPIKRHSRLVEKFPHVHTQDTIIQRDTIRLEIPKVEVDTIFKLDSFQVALHDTIFIEKERLKIKMYTIHDSVFVEGSCDTIFVEKIIERKVPIRYYKENEDKPYVAWLKGIGLILLIFLILFAIYKFIRLFKDGN